MITITAHAVEKSTFAVLVSFFDETGQPVVPNNIIWTLTDAKATVINQESQVAVSVPAATVTILLEGDDLAFQDDEIGPTAKRLITVEADYDSNLGSGLPFKEQAEFFIDNLTVIS